MLQQVFVLQQQLVDSSLSLQSGRGLCAQLVPQKVDLQETRGGANVWVKITQTQTHTHTHGSQAFTRLMLVHVYYVKSNITMSLKTGLLFNYKECSSLATSRSEEILISWPQGLRIRLELLWGDPCYQWLFTKVMMLYVDFHFPHKESWKHFGVFW